MPRYNPNPASLTATIPVLPPDTYAFVIGEPKAFAGQNAKKEDNYGIRLSLVVDNDGPMKGKRIPLTLYMHSDGAAQMSKQFQMAAYGYPVNPEGEEAFNAELGNEDWSYDTDSNSVGTAWAQMKGRRVTGQLGIQFGKNADGSTDTSRQFQAFEKWFPYSD